MIELYRNIILTGKYISENEGMHYRIIQGARSWHAWQYEALKNKATFFEDCVGPGGFVIPDVDSEELKEIITAEEVAIRCEIWKLDERAFDPHNYSQTFKVPIDHLVGDGFIQDDSWKFVNGVTFVGGGPSAWEKRAYRHSKEDGLPNSEDEFYAWQLKMSDNDRGSALIRVLIEKVS